MKKAVLSVLSFVFFYIPHAAGAMDLPRLLVLHSYHPNYQWTENINKGIFQEIDSVERQIDVKVEYMDILNRKNTDHFDILLNLYKHKYRSSEFNAIICSDNYALNFLVENRDELFPETPVIFCGINRFSDEILKGIDHATGVVEDIDLEESVKLVLKLHEKIDQIVIWSVVHKRSEANRSLAVSLINEIKPDLKIVHLRDKHITEGIEAVNKLKGKSAVFLMSIVRDEKGDILPVGLTARTIASNINVPVYSLWDFFLGHGIVGGKLISGVRQGEISAQMALRVVDGEPVSELPIVRKSPNQFMFDYKQLERFGIDQDRLPQDSFIINEPVSVYDKYKFVIWTIIFVIMLLTVLVISQTLNIIKRIRLESELQQHKDQLERRVEQRTKELAEANDSLKQSERKLEKAQELAKVGHYVLDIQSETWKSSPKLDEILGIDETFEKNITSWLMLIHPDHQDMMEKYFQFEVLTNHKKFDKNYRIIDFQSGQEKWVHGLGDLKFDENGSPIEMFGTIQDITERIKLENEREKLIEELKEALTNVEILSGLLPICAECKKVRDDQGYWNNLEGYIEKHSGASFSHGMCPECSDKLYGDQEWYIQMKKKKGYDS